MLNLKSKMRRIARPKGREELLRRGVSKVDVESQAIAVLTGASLMLGMLFSLISAFDREEMRSVTEMDEIECSDRLNEWPFCYTMNYEKYFFYFGWSAVALNSMAVLISIIVMMLLHAHGTSSADEDRNGFDNNIAASYSRDVLMCYILLLCGMICSACAATPLWMIKMNNSAQRAFAFFSGMGVTAFFAVASVFYTVRFCRLQRYKKSLVRTLFKRSLSATSAMAALNKASRTPQSDDHVQAFRDSAEENSNRTSRTPQSDDRIRAFRDSDN